MKTPFILTEQTTVHEIVTALDQSGIGFLAIVDPSDKLIGIVTDGDLRKAILKDQFNLDEVINRNPITADERVPKEALKRKLRSIRRHHMPIVNSEGTFIDLFILNDFQVPTKDNWVVIMAGGLGSRLGELTKDTPKPMLEIEGRPIIQHIMESYAESGYRKFVLCVNYKSHIIEEYFDDGREFGYEIIYTHENKRLGTAGALSLIEQDWDHPFFVTNGDVISNVNFEDLMSFHTSSDSRATMCIKSFSQEVPFACVEFSKDQDLLELKEKPSYNYFINAGIYVLDGDLLSQIPKDVFYDMPAFFEELVAKDNQVKVFRMEDYWIDVGRPDDYKRVKEDFAG